MFNNRKAQQAVVVIAMLALLLSGLATLFVPSSEPNIIAPAPDYSISVEGV